MEYVPVPFHDDDSEVRNVETLSVLAAARRAGVTQSAILRWIRNGYLSATPSSDGWQIPAHMLEDARRAANEGRGTGPAPRRAHPTLEPSPTPIRRSMETRSIEIADAPPASVEAFGESVVAPLAELIRDQIDVVHDQAEVIGWLQAERERLSKEVAGLKSLENHVDVEAADVETTAEQNDYQADDALVSLLWKDSARSDEIDALSVFVDDEAHIATPEPNSNSEEPEADTPNFDGWFVEGDSATEFSDSAEERPELRVEDYADPSWFFVPNDSMAFGSSNGPARTAPKLKPIVQRPEGIPKAVADAVGDNELRDMIDETERKIAQLWQNEEQLRMSRPGNVRPARHDEDTEPERGSIWQRLWPSRR